ncbi:hypothetical protein SDC9_209280 [bioreactor metagenome]|uniref:Uncharacterized protein n=1 Tax=bioreactor metagenome TaxID=1076179 RepID=A0A645JEC9_9ZZZZ
MINRAMGQTGISSVFCGIRMCTRFRGTEIIACGDDHGIHSVHNSLVVRGCTKRFNFGNRHGPLEFGGKLLVGNSAVVIQFVNFAGNFGPNNAVWRVI